ncbi:hypothetical protein Rs2_38583 [Raphanus sativus]|nr:hypothetical protein Rs2_38583 [Raphanus sativus]
MARKICLHDSPGISLSMELQGTREEGLDDPIIAFKKATDAISGRRDSFSRNASGDGTTTAGNKRRMIRRSDDSSPSQGGKPREGVSTRSQRPSLTGCKRGRTDAGSSSRQGPLRDYPAGSRRTSSGEV